jgi:GNAT superfamily N-acetyltransferase
MSNTEGKFKIYPLTPERWPDLEKLFGPRGAVGGCWCMYWRLTSREYDELKGPGNRALLKDLVDTVQVPGLLAYLDGEVAGWCSLGPREVYSRLERSRTLARPDDQPVWSIVCFFIQRKYRRSGISERLLEGAIAYARTQGVKILEGYPVEPKKGEMPSVFAYTGLASTFHKLGFKEVTRRSDTRPIMRLELDGEDLTEKKSDSQ